MRPVTVQVTGVAASAPVPLDLYLDPFNVSLQVIPGAGNTYTVEWTCDDIWATGWDPNTANWFQGPANLVAANTAQAGSLESPVTAVRVRNTVAGANPTTMRVVQAGAAQ